MAGQRHFSPEDYTVGWICALPVAAAAAQEMLDEEYGEFIISPHDNNIYTLGRVGEHNVVIACLPDGDRGTNPAAVIATKIQRSFPSILLGLMVGVGGGVLSSTNPDIRLGDVAVSMPGNAHGGVIQYDFGKHTPSPFLRTGSPDAPPKSLQIAVSHLRARHSRVLRRRMPRSFFL